MNGEACLVLEDGSVYQGECFGAPGTAYGEVVFNTSMTGYQEILTDPSYAGQIVVATYPLIGNYGVNAQDVESKRIQVAGYVVRQQTSHPSHHDSTGTIHEYLAAQGVPGISEVDTRALTRRLRSQGVMMGCLTSEMGQEEALDRLRHAPRYVDVDYVASVSTEVPYVWQGTDGSTAVSARWRVVVMDCGLKYNILRNLKARGCAVTVVPARTTAQEVLALEPDGVVLSPGPGDPALLGYAVRMVEGLVGRVPIMGICLGHQLLARAFGARTYKLKFGHRGGNHPVKDLVTGRVYITAQNHGFAVDADTLPPGLEVSHVNLNDGTVEVLFLTELPILWIQFHSEASPGPWDNEYLFDRFLSKVKEVA
ncbi:MAG: glutamine-hydrolyzing carbamoyl-phosphate synthase small subunit, partial [Dehalococcoidia bacterium]|nr:glutamine-hydrolyzing carbamoyl-phosphate synthase small subunit [Dehalococcoidia bacterium]